jgi:predicted signal transduction protein with EAL and GGDEF domain
LVPPVYFCRHTTKAAVATIRSPFESHRVPPFRSQLLKLSISQKRALTNGFFYLTVIAEGIEDRSTANLTARIGCKLGQGYFFGEPMPAKEFEQRFLSGSSEDTGATLKVS